MMKVGLVSLGALGAAVAVNLGADTSTESLNNPTKERDPLNEITIHTKDIQDLSRGSKDLSRGSYTEKLLPEENDERKEWDNPMEFLFILVGYAIGIGNLWRFPYLCCRYGGGAFIVAYLVGLFFCAGPLFLYELVLGQTFQKGPVETFEALHPKWKYVAYVPLFMISIINTYYSMVVAYAVIYFFASFINPLPWAEDSNDYFYSDVLNASDTMDSPGAYELQWKLVLGLMSVWVMTYASLARGLSGAAKVAYVTVSVPFLLIAILLFRVVNLPGAGAGVSYYLNPQLEYLADFETWSQAVGQILFSLSPATGVAIAMASHNKKDYTGITRDAATIMISNSTFSLLCGFVVFSVIGNIAEVENIPIEDVSASGASLAFVVFSRGLSLFSSNQAVCGFFSALFFATLTMVGLDSVFANTATMNTYMQDFLASRNDGQPTSKRFQDLSLLGICVGTFLAGLLYATRSGFWYLDVVDHFCPTFCLLIIAFLEYVLFGWVYGVDKMIENIRERCPDNNIPGLAVGSNFEWIWHLQMKFFGPLFLGALTINQVRLEFNGSQTAVDEYTGIETYGGYNFYSVLIFGWGGIAAPLIAVAIATFNKDVYNAIMPCFGYERIVDEPRASEKQMLI